MSAIDQVRAWLRDVHRGRRLLICSEVLQTAGHQATRYRDLGAESMFLVAARNGAGDLPDEPYALLDLPPMPFMALIHGAQDALQQLPPEVEARIEAWDPEHRAVTVGPFYFRGDPVAGRPYFGRRSADIQALEDKARIDQVWDAVGIARAPSRVLQAEREGLVLAHRALDEGAGTVWAADSREGFNGGGAGTRWVRNEAAIDEVFDDLSDRADRIRVMPFLDGIPCSIHGIVFASDVVVLRPAEMVVLRRPDSTRFRYLRAGTFWDPPPADRHAMRTVARRLGDHLRNELNYRGAFTIDGVMTATGFRPTECNPRVGAALTLMVPSFDFSLVSEALFAGAHPRELDTRALEAELLAVADAQRQGSMGILTDTPFDETVRHHLAWRHGSWVEVDEAKADANLMAGPGPRGGFINLKLVGDRVPQGISLGTRAVAFIDWADLHLGTAEGPCEAAPDLRSDTR